MTDSKEYSGLLRQIIRLLIKAVKTFIVKASDVCVRVCVCVCVCVCARCLKVEHASMEQHQTKKAQANLSWAEFSTLGMCVFGYTTQLNSL